MPVWVPNILVGANYTICTIHLCTDAPVGLTTDAFARLLSFVCWRAVVCHDFCVSLCHGDLSMITCMFVYVCMCVCAYL